MAAKRGDAAPGKRRGRKAPSKPGQAGDPACRAEVARDTLGQAFVHALHEDFEAHGVAAIETVRAERPLDYLKVVAGILPKDLNVNVNKFDDLTDAQLLERIRQLDAAVQPFLATQGAAGNRGGTEKTTRH